MRRGGGGGSGGVDGGSPNSTRALTVVSFAPPTGIHYSHRRSTGRDTSSVTVSRLVASRTLRAPCGQRCGSSSVWSPPSLQVCKQCVCERERTRMSDRDFPPPKSDCPRTPITTPCEACEIVLAAPFVSPYIANRVLSGIWFTSLLNTPNVNRTCR